MLGDPAPPRPGYFAWLPSRCPKCNADSTEAGPLYICEAYWRYANARTAIEGAWTFNPCRRLVRVPVPHRHMEMT